MAENVYAKINAASFRVKYRDYFNLSQLYTVMHEWLVEEGWATREDSSFPEKFMMHKFNPNDGDEVWVWWRFEKPSPNKKFYLWKLNIDIHVLMLRSAEIMHNGQKLKANYGEPEIKIKADVITDPKGEWKKHPILKHFLDIYRANMMKKETLHQKVLLHREAYRFQEMVKSQLKLRTWLPQGEDQRFFRKGDYSI